MADLSPLGVYLLGLALISSATPIVVKILQVMGVI